MNNKQYKKHIRSLSKTDLKEHLQKQLNVVIEKYFNYIESKKADRYYTGEEAFLNTLYPLEIALQGLKEEV